MAMTIDSTLRLLPTDEAARDAEGAETLTLEWKGAYSACKATADTIEPGAAIPTIADGNAYTPAAGLYDGYHAVSWTVRRRNGDTAILSVACRKADATDPSPGGDGATVPFRTVYSVKSVRNDVSILAYCGDSPPYPNRAAIERWMREPDAKLAAAFKYRDGDGSVVDIAEDGDLSCSVPVIRKIMRGAERVIRFYPQLTIKRQFYAPPPNDFARLAHIDEPPPPSGEKTLSPSGIATLISEHEWLKVQDDCDEQQDSTWMRVESWIGIRKDASHDGRPWDRNLYGEEPDRWEMPAFQPEEYEPEEEGGGES